MSIRLDIALERRGLCQSRARARDAILRGTVTVNGVPAKKPNQSISDDDLVIIDDPAAHYVSRAALKLIAGLDAGAIPVAGKTCLDLGASTGGFTQVLAERGAAKIYAVDVGHDQMHPAVLALPQVTSLEGINAKSLDRSVIVDAIDLLVCDVSFVSLVKIIDAPLALCAPDAQAVLLIKPQFEVGRDNVGKGGIVVPGAHVEASVAAVIETMTDAGWTLINRLPSPVAGGDGNLEHIAVFTRQATDKP